VKGRFRVPIYAGENAIFSDDAAAKMVGQTTKDGDVVLATQFDKNQPNRIVLTIEKELPTEYTGFIGLNGGAFSMESRPDEKTTEAGVAIPSESPLNRPQHVDHPDDERYDSITIETLERWKDSELSGDEWRFSYLVTAWRKGEQIIVSSWSRLDWALKALQHTIYIRPEGGDIFNREAWDRTKTLCDQPGCSSTATIFYKRLKPYTKQGEELVDHTWRNEYRQFCVRHKHRGDCDLDDADHNYELIENPNG
jgi:hypothetical protein